MAVETFLSYPYVRDIILPFLLVFTLVFAILDKTEILGEGKKQINAIIGFVVGLLLVAFPYPRDIIVNLMPLLAVIIAVFLVFMISYGLVAKNKDDNLEMPKGVKIAAGILTGLALLIALLVFTGAWDYLSKGFLDKIGKGVFANIFFVLIIVAAIVIVISTGKNSGSEQSS